MNKFLYKEAFDSGLFGFWTPFGAPVLGFFAPLDAGFFVLVAGCKIC